MAPDHTTFDFSRDRLIWDTGHQIYPHKLITGRYQEFGSMRTKGGLMGYPNPEESEYDLFMTGHAGASVSTALGLASVNVIFACIADFTGFTPDNDPWGEHDCAAMTVLNHRIIWKIDYYDRSRTYHSPDPADPKVTVRVMTVMLAEEY